MKQNLSTFGQAKSFLLVLVSFCFIAAFVYRWGSVALPRGDHGDFVAERQFYSSEGDFFKAVLSFNRTRHQNPGDFFLFRPGHMAVLAVQDIFFHNSYRAIGWFSIALHALVAFLLYTLLLRIAPPVLAYVLALNLLCSFVSSEMVLWRHISPYLFSLVFFSLGVLLFSQKENTELGPVKLGLSSVSFFIASLFHEFPTLAIPIAVLSYSVLNRRFDRSHLWLIAPSVLYWMWNWLDYRAHFETLPILAKAAAEQGAFWRFPIPVVEVLGAMVSSFCLPFIVHISWDSFLGRAFWNLNRTPLIVLFLLVGTSFIFVFWRWGKGRRFDWCWHLYASCFLTFVLGVGAGRVALRGLDYLGNSLYYFYFSTFFLSLLVAFALQRVWRKKWVGRGITLLILLLALIQCIQIAGALHKSYAQTTRIADIVKSFDLFMRSHPHYCFAEALDPQTEQVINPLNQFRFTCGVHPAMALVARSGSDASIELVKDHEVVHKLP